MHAIGSMMLKFLGLILMHVVVLSLQAAQSITISPHTFTLPDGYQITQVAAPPLVKRPIHMGFDVEGVLFVTDSSGNSSPAPAQLKNPQHRLLRLQDKNGDGIYDSSTVFADRLPFPEGVLVYDDAVYVAAPPKIWRFKDTTGDQVADERTVWFDGGSIENCGNDLHGPYRGPDGFFYWSKGAFAPQTHRLGDGRTFKSNAAHIYRARPDGSQLEVVITGGMNNPVGLAFNEVGERFLSGTFFDLSRPGRRDGILHAIYGGMYGRKNDRVLAPHPGTGGLLPILSQMGPAAPSGMIMPENDALGLRGDLLCTDFNLRRLSRHELTRDGSSYSSITTTLLESDQSDFHPTDVIEDADGSLLIADTGSWYKICCPTSKVSKPHILGSIYRVRKIGAAIPEDPRGVSLDWSQPSVDWLSDERHEVVKRAMESLASGQRVEELKHAPAHIPAVWTLNRIAGEAARAAVREFLGADDADVRAAALHSVALWRDAGAVDAVITQLKSNDARERRLAAMALGRIGADKALPALLDSRLHDADPFLRHAITYALYEMGSGVDMPGDHPLAAQVGRMHEVAQRHVPPPTMPEIRLAEAMDPDPEMPARLEELSRLLPQGDPVRGKKLFNHTAKSLCLTCHMLGEQGVKFGPDLTGIGSIRSEQDLLEAIVYPSASIARYYETVSVEKKGGPASGLILEDGEKHLVLSAAPGVEQSIPYRRIKSAHYLPVSMMPEVFDGLLKPREIVDLVAYLQSEKLPDVSEAVDAVRIPPHQPVALPGLHAYAQKSIAAGEDIEFRVSSRVPYQLSVVKLGADPDNRENDPVLKTFDIDAPRSQPIHPGSYVHVANGLPSERRLNACTLEGWFRPFSLDGWQGLITQHDYPHRAGIGLFLNQSRVVFITAGGGAFDPASLHQTRSGLIKPHHWHHLVASWDGKTKRIYIDGKPVAEFPFVGAVRPGQTALRLGAYGSEGVATSFFNGDLAQCVVYGKALTAEQVAKRFAGQGYTAVRGTDVLGSWPFSEERGTKVADSGPDGRDGRIVNRGTWMIGGPGFDATSIGRHDRSYNPVQDPNRGHGLRLAADELYDARWEVSHRFQIPADARPGVYAGRFDFDINGKAQRYFTTFIVRKPAEQKKAPLLVLMSSNTWLAYNSVPFPVNHGPELIKMGTGGLPSSHTSAPTYSFYSDHRNGQPTYKVGMKVPWPAGGPNKTYINQSYSHLLRGERFLQLWLDRHGYAYDVITDFDLHENPGVLKGYKAVCINGHSEYWSIPAYEGLGEYLSEGGAAVVMSGNTMFWRVSFDESGEVMECRKYGRRIGGRARAKVGELYHSHDFQRGSLMRFCGYPAWEMVGLTCIGWGGGNFGTYKVDHPDHFLFTTPHATGLKKGDSFGQVSGMSGSVGHEYDVRLSTILKATANPVLKGLVEPDGITTLARSGDGRSVLDFNAEAHKRRVGGEQTIAEIIYWERPQGGKVFHTGSIATAWSLYSDEKLGRLIKNVLHHFGVPETKTDR